MFNSVDILKFKNYVQKIIERPRPMAEQPMKRESIFLWCDDWEIIEILKYLFNGREGYYGDPPPNRLKFNPLWSKDDIAQKTEALIKEYQTADNIIEHLKKRREAHFGSTA